MSPVHVEVWHKVVCHNSKRILVRKILWCTEIWKFEEQKFPQNGMPNLRKFCGKPSFAYWKILLKCQDHEQFLLNWHFFASQSTTPSVKLGESTGMITKFLYIFKCNLKSIPYLQKTTSTQELNFSSHFWYWMRHLSHQSFLIEKPSVVR